MRERTYENNIKHNINFSNEDVRSLIKIILEKTNSSTLYELIERKNFRDLLKDIDNTSIVYNEEGLIIKNKNLLYYIKPHKDVIDIKEGVIIYSYGEYSFAPLTFIEVREKEKQNYNSIITEVISEAKHFNEKEEREYSKYVVKIIIKDVNANQIREQATSYSSEKLNKKIEEEREKLVKVYKSNI